MSVVRVDIVVIGNGPAASASAIAATHAGARVHVVDTADVWAIFPDLRILARTAERPLELAARAVVVATGAHDRAVPFPGWTLPGVMSSRSAQRSGIAFANARVVVAGSGPPVLAATRALRGAGASIAASVDTSPRARTRGAIVIAALGAPCVEAVRIARLDAHGCIDRGECATIANIDALVTAWGSHPAIEVSSLLRCAHAYDDARGGWYCEADGRTGQTSVAHVFAAGDVTGVAGARAAWLAGRLAGIAAAVDVGCAPRLSTAEVDALERRALRARTVGADLAARSVPPPTIDELCTLETIVCPCEQVTRAQLTSAMRDGATTVLGAKHWTRAGMGRCQGRLCSAAVARVLASGDPAAAGYNRPRIPLHPVALATVAAALRDDDRDG